MSVSRRVLMMFLPLAILVGAVATVTLDLKFPLSDEKDTCTVIQVGPLVRKLTGSYVIDQGSLPIHDIAFQCRHLGQLRVNEAEVFRQMAVEPHMTAILTRRQYRIWPEQWYFQLNSTTKTH